MARLTTNTQAKLKLNLSELNTKAQPSPNAGSEPRPAWEFDYSEISLGSRIGAGAFGEVYEASWRRSRIAVKRLLCQKLTESARREFMAEMELMSNLRHPHIVRFLGACLEPLHMSILFELCATSLYDVLHVKRQSLTIKYSIQVLKQVALGIFYLHQCKLPVLHLDLKSANVLLDEHGVAKVCDFGLSHIKKETAVITARMGSPQWSAPEILRGKPHDESADTYSFGILLYEIMSCELPYRGVDTFQVVIGVITKMLARPELPAECAFPQQLQELMRLCISEEPDDRPRLDRILDVADEALEQLALRPQLSGASLLPHFSPAAQRPPDGGSGGGSGGAAAVGSPRAAAPGSRRGRLPGRATRDVAAALVAALVDVGQLPPSAAHASMNQQTSCGGLSAGGAPSSAAVLSGGGAQPRSGSPTCVGRTWRWLVRLRAQLPAELVLPPR